MKPKNKHNTRVVFVNSVKGGAGKTTIALALAVSAFRDLAIKADSEASSAGGGAPKTTTPNICYLDADLLGTGVTKILFGDDKGIQYFNDSYDDYGSYIKPINLVGLESLANANYGKLECILLSDDPQKKGRFIKNPQVRSSHVNMNDFENRFKKLLNKLIISERYEYIIVDCSPGYDSLSRALINSASKLLNGNNSDNIKSLFVTTLDTAHMHVTISLACHILLTETGIIKPIIVVNDTSDYLCSRAKSKDKPKPNFKKDIEPSMKEDMQAKFEQMKATGADYESSANPEDIQIKLHNYTGFTDSMIYTNKKHINNTNVWDELDLNSFKSLLGG